MKRTKIILIPIAAGLVAVLSWIGLRSSTPPNTTYTEMMESVRLGQVDTVRIQPTNAGAAPAIYQLKDGKNARALLPGDYRDAMKAMQQASVNIEIQEPAFAPLRPLANAIPFLLLLGTWLFLMGRKASGNLKLLF